MPAYTINVAWNDTFETYEKKFVNAIDAANDALGLIYGAVLPADEWKVDRVAIQVTPKEGS